MKRVKRRGADDDEPLAASALEDLAGPALVLDASLAIVLATAGAVELVGTDVPLGVSAPKLLCGASVNRPIAEALAKGVAVTGTVMRPAPGGVERRVVVRATPIERAGNRIGWVLLLAAEASEQGDVPVLFHGMWTRDGAMKHAFHIAERAARRDASVLLRGETGTGKELFARAIHALSPRAKGPFAAINCAALPATLLESELFGHVRGAFTGAVRDQPGFFKSADHGTAFLDEVAEMPLDLQAKLLRVLETKTVIPVGGRDPIAVDVRIVAATHQSLRAAVERGRFRADLMYRLRVIPIFVPPLRARPADVALLAQKIIEELNRQGGRRVTRISPAALAVLERHPWPGNVRELRNALEYAYVIGEGPVLVPGDLPAEIAEPGSSPDVVEAATRVNAPAPAPEGEPAEVTRVRRALERAGGNRERAAQILGISRVTLWRRMRELGIDDGGA
ncbi:sigma-54 interaction domain-containing protein [Sandaracinus amylolyticus]|uniref:Sigma-54 dependent transcriptional regulator n=1 Tax=Sandaracinus amylolyticus TaxID=927083 RepID=A0A0F6W0B1_9BACT|nr:sigma-54-dependent Fis family transcriptional regulator [Sandaracinus amylolyticus]AKF04200.1 Sigma-54 dependent transcriptional regulator [Sandaracinus amylolyticus]